MPLEPFAPVFVGRERELGTVRTLLDRSAAEDAQTLVVAGDAGVGKTALVARACAGRAGAVTIFGACLPLASMSIPMLPIRSALRGLDERTDATGMVDLDADDRDVMVRFDDWLARRCRDEHVVLIVDDVQWADHSTLDALMYVIAGPARRRLTVVTTLRAGEVGLGHPLQRWLADIRRLPRTAELLLGPLDRAATAEQIRALLGEIPHQSLIDDVHRRSRGNPYLTRLMVSGLPPDARAAPTTFPADLSSAVLQSWFRLSPETRRLASVLAVGGGAMRAVELADVVGESDPESIRQRLVEAVDSGTLEVLDDGSFWFHHPMSAEVLAAALGEDERREWHRRFADLLEAPIVPPVPVGRAVAIADHRFGAGDTRAAYEWALRAADAAGDVAGWAEQLRLLRRAVRLRSELPDAAESLDDLLRRLRWTAADVGATADELDAVESLLGRLDAHAEPLTAAELRVRRMHLRFMLGLAFIEVDEMQEAVRLAAVDPASPEYALALAELAHAESWKGEPEASEHARRAIAIARSAGDPRALSVALTAGSMAASIAEDMPVAVALGREALAPALLARDWWAYVHASMWAANAVETWASRAYAAMMRDRRIELERYGGPHAYIAWLSAAEALSWLTSGAWREAEARLRVALGSDPGPLGDIEARLAAARLAVLQGRQAEAEGHLARVDELVVDGSAFLAVEYDAVHAEVRLAAGDPEGAYAAALTGAADGTTPPTMAEWLMPLAARALADRAQAARDAADPVEEVLATLDALFERFPHVIEDRGTTTDLVQRQLRALDAMYYAEGARARADVDAGDRWTIAAEACADARLPWEEAYSSWRAAEALLGRGHDRRTGAAMLRHGLALARQLRARPVEDELLDLARRARIPIEEPAAAASVAPAALHGLTEREREVLDLIAVGRTYAEIARALMISDKTVSTHVSHLLTKTGTGNRVELARLVHRVTTGHEEPTG